MTTWKKTSWMVLLIASATMFVGCEKFTMKRFDSMIFAGQSKWEVEKILGEPWMKSDNMWHYRNKKTLDSATVKFNDSGSVIDKQWDGRDKHPDSKPGAMTVEVQTEEMLVE
jgi:hypothetical protein